MDILFIDESKPPTDRDKLTPSNSIFVLSGLVIQDNEWKKRRHTAPTFQIL